MIIININIISIPDTIINFLNSLNFLQKYPSLPNFLPKLSNNLNLNEAGTLPSVS